MKLIVYADFNCPYSCLASARADALLDRGVADIDWRAVEHDPTIRQPSQVVDGELMAMLDREVAEVRGLLRPGELFHIQRPPVQANTALAVRAFAAAVDGAHELRKRLFAALWFDGRDIATPEVVRDLGGDPTAPEPAIVSTWRHEWLELQRPLVPMLVLPDGYVSRGLGALARLADLATSPPVLGPSSAAATPA
ncbi:MAG: DsbA family protein [Ilumatobacteraceae bacterium]